MVKYDIRRGVRKIKTRSVLIASGAVISIAGLLMSGALPILSHAESLSNINFESPTYTVGNINGQDGWVKTGAYDAAVVANTYSIPSFGTQTLRISDGVTSGSFGDQTFSKPLVNEAGETDALNGGMSGGTRLPHFEAQFDLASALSTLQTGMHVSVSPDRGDGARMSYLRFEDQVDGIHVFFDDVQGTSNLANFVETDIATISRAPHTIKFVIDFVDGPSNDVVKIFIDGALKTTGTTWENYYRFDPESNPSLVSNSRTVDSLLFRESGTANPSDTGNGFLIDNMSLLSSAIPTVSAPTITSPANNSTQTSAQLVKVDWTDVTGTSPVTYQYESYLNSSYTTLAYSSGWLTASEIPTPGTPNGDYYLRVRAQDGNGYMSPWSNSAANPYKITVADQVVVVHPATKEQCMNNGWKTLTDASNKPFKNQGDCVSYVATNGKNKANG